MPKSNQATKEQLEERVQKAVSMLQTGARPYRVSSQLMKEYNVGRHQAGRYVARARQRTNIDEAANRGMDYLVGLLEGNNPPNLKIDAAKTLVKNGKIHRVEHSGPNGNPIDVNRINDAKSRLNKMAKRHEQSGQSDQ